MKKKIRQVDGIKVIYHHSAPVFLIGLFCLSIGAMSVLSLFFPFLCVELNGHIYQAKLLTMVNSFYVWAPTTNLIDGPNPLYTLASQVLNEWIVYVVQGLLFFAAILLVFIIIFDVLLILNGVWLILIGKSHHMQFGEKVAKGVMKARIILTICFAAIMLLFIFLGNVSFSAMTYWYILIELGVTILCYVLIYTIRSVEFNNFIWGNEIGELYRQLGEDQEKLVQEPYIVDHVYKEVPKVQYITATGLPPTITTIGGHEFSMNQHLVNAVIPQGIPSIGIGAFANCGSLKVVSIPRSVKEIGANAFFNDVSLKRIYYGGTKEQWRHITRGSNWLYKAGTTTVTCIDGAIIVNPLH